jgi:carbon-monoxide dehydrogenase small subunit
MPDLLPIAVTVNGCRYERLVEGRIHLADFLRHDLEMTGTHVGCEHGVCGACTVLLDGISVRSCLVLAAQANGRTVETIEGLTMPDGTLHPLQAALGAYHGLQCGYCTPGVLMTLVELRRESRGRKLDENEVRRALSGNLCRCTGYQGIVDAALHVLGDAGVNEC